MNPSTNNWTRIELSYYIIIVVNISALILQDNGNTVARLAEVSSLISGK